MPLMHETVVSDAFEGGRRDVDDSLNVKVWGAVFAIWLILQL